MAYEIKGMHSYRGAAGTREFLIAAALTGTPVDVFKYNSATDGWIQQGRAYTAGSTPEFATFLDRVFAVNINDASETYNGSSWSTSDQVTNAPKAKYLMPYLDRMYFAYVDITGTTHYSRVVYSSLPDINGDIIWDPTVNYFDVARDDGDIIRGLGENSNRLLIFKENSLYRWDTNQLFKVPAAPGTVSNRTIKNLQGRTIYLHRSGLWLYDGNTSNLISRPIEDIINAISALNIGSTCAWVKGDEYFCYIGDIDTGEIEIDKCVIVYNIANKSITVESIAHEIVATADHVDDSSDVYYNDTRYDYSSDQIGYSGYTTSEAVLFLGTSSGRVLKWDDGNTHAGTPIVMDVETKEYYPGNPSSDKDFYDVLVYAKYGSSTSIAMQVDEGPWITLGQLYAPISQFKVPEEVSLGKKCKFKFKEASINTPVEIEGIDVYYKERPFI